MTSTVRNEPRVASPSPKVFRPEIEGLRAVAALLVAVWHIWVGGVSGGVDVFFVVSGFLITTTLLGHLDRYGFVRPGVFLGRLARRLLPSAAVVLLITLAGVWLITPAALRSRAFSEIIASALYVENWQLAYAAVDYLNSEDPHSPVQHFWAMSVQGQFYVLWAVVFLIAVVVARRTTAVAKRLAFGGVAALFAVSLTYSVWRTAENQPFAYFDSGARAWEFALGALAAFVIARVSVHGRTAFLLGWVGLLAIVFCGTLLPVATSFPGIAALWPTTAALLVLAAGSGRDRVGHAPWLLSRKPLVWLGGLSYGIYLWHWPLLIFARQLLGTYEVGILVGIAIICSSVALSWFTTKLLERPIRRHGEKSPRARLLVTGLLVVSVTAVAGAAGTSQRYDEVLAERQAELAADHRNQAIEAGCHGAEAMSTGFEACSYALADAPLLPIRSELLADTGGAYACYTVADATDIQTCSLGSDQPDALRMAIVGNSHAAMLVAALRPHLEALNWRLDTFVGNGCVWGEINDSERCAQRLAQMDEHIIGEPYDVLLTSSGRGDRDYSQARVDEYLTAWSKVSELGTRVVVVEDNPRMTEVAASCVINASDDELREGVCDFDATEGYKSPDLMLAAAELSGGAFAAVETRDWYCFDQTCPAVVGGVIVYRDLHHLTATYVDSLAPELVERIRYALG